jgi:hypothetical protein
VDRDGLRSGGVNIDCNKHGKDDEQYSRAHGFLFSNLWGVACGESIFASRLLVVTSW